MFCVDTSRLSHALVYFLVGVKTGFSSRHINHLTHSRSSVELLNFCFLFLFSLRDPSFKVRNSLRSNYFVVMKKFMPWLKAALKIHKIPSFFTYYYYLLDFHLFYISPSSISLSSNLSSFMPNSFYNILSKFFLILLDLLPLPLIIYISI